MTDLKQRGLLDSTLVVWGGEFGRNATRDRNGNDNPGRDHNNKAFSVWLAGGGVKGGTIYGATDDFGARAVENRVHIHDLHATILRLLGFDHTKLTYRYNGRDFRLTDVAGTWSRGSSLEDNEGDMMKHFSRSKLVMGGLVAPAVGMLAAPRSWLRSRPKAELDFFENKIRPILANQLLQVPQPRERKVKGGLSLEYRESVLKGGETGPAIVPGDPEKSLLIKAIRYTGSGSADATRRAKSFPRRRSRIW